MREHPSTPWVVGVSIRPVFTVPTLFSAGFSGAGLRADLKGKLGTRPPTNHAAESLAFVEIALVSASGVQWIGRLLDLPAW
ncbi:rCG50495 [Rattus norvegicus]|uniref:RCG50495 n=1 Tax=Rattus norvegicus TaxID=10116 RepID=A6JZ25_RAT|nr:rCG50495 [Rattus norvegicus]